MGKNSFGLTELTKVCDCHIAKFLEDLIMELGCRLFSVVLIVSKNHSISHPVRGAQQKRQMILFLLAL